MSELKTLSVAINTEEAVNALNMIVDFAGKLNIPEEKIEETEAIEYHLTEIAKIISVATMKFDIVDF